MSDRENPDAEGQSAETTPVSTDESSVTSTIQEQSQTLEYFSPIPLPNILKGYKEIDPTFPERIMSEFEKNSEHARKQEKDALEAQIKESTRGQYMAFFLSIALLGLILFSLYIDNDTSAFVSGLAFIGLVVKSFLPKNQK